MPLIRFCCCFCCRCRCLCCLLSGAANTWCTPQAKILFSDHAKVAAEYFVGRRCALYPDTWNHIKLKFVEREKKATRNDEKLHPSTIFVFFFYPSVSGKTYVLQWKWWVGPALCERAKKTIRCTFVNRIF